MKNTDNQIIRIPYKYSELFDTMEDCECWKLCKALFRKDSENLSWLSKTYYNIIIVDILNIENQVLKWKAWWKKGWRPKNNPEGLDKNNPPLSNLKTQDKVSKDKVKKDKIKTVNRNNNSKELQSEIVWLSFSEKDISEKKPETEKEEYWNPEINQMLDFLKKLFWRNDFKESQVWQRRYLKHILNLMNKIWRDLMIKKLSFLKNDEFKLKHCGSLKYIFSELKSLPENLEEIETKKTNWTAFFEWFE